MAALVVMVAGMWWALSIPNRNIPYHCPEGTACDPDESQTVDKRGSTRIAILVGSSVVAGSLIFVGMRLTSTLEGPATIESVDMESKQPR